MLASAERRGESSVERRGDLTRRRGETSPKPSTLLGRRGGKDPEGEKASILTGLAGPESCTLFRAIGHSTLRLKGCRPRVAIFNSMGCTLTFVDIKLKVVFCLDVNKS